MAITKTQVLNELGQQPYRIECTLDAEEPGKLSLRDITPDQRGIHLSFLAARNLGKHGSIELRFDEKGQLIKTLVEAQ